MSHRESPVLFSVDLRDCKSLADREPADVSAAFAAALERAGASVVKASSHVFPGGGLTSVLILRESHAVIHTWPETGTVNIDIFSCTTRLRSLEAVEELRGFLGAGEFSMRALPRADGHRPESMAGD